MNASWFFFHSPENPSPPDRQQSEHPSARAQLHGRRYARLCTFPRPHGNRTRADVLQVTSASTRHDGCVASCNPTLFVTRCCNHTYPSWPVDARDARGTGSPGTNETTRGRTTALDRVTTDATVCSALLVHHPLWFDNQFWGRTREMCELCLKGGHLGTRF